jgi:hypothetical protein
MKTNPTAKDVIVWTADGFERVQKENGIVYYDKDGDEIFMDRESIDFVVAIHFQRLEEYIKTLNRSGCLSDVHHENLKTIIAAGKKEIFEHYQIIRKHLGAVHVERSDDEVVGCVLEMRH